jgi:proteasome lid subunit RPN8/RPN11
VTAPTPERLELDGHCLIVLERTLLASAPEEGCALLLGQQRAATLSLKAIWPCCNIWQPSSERLFRFSLDPREQLLAQRWCRTQELVVLGAAHSHPCSEASPSETDRHWCVGPTLMLIRSGLGTGRQALRAWWMPENDLERDTESIAEHDTKHDAGIPIELPIELVGEAPGAGDLGE